MGRRLGFKHLGHRPFTRTSGDRRAQSHCYSVGRAGPGWSGQELPRAGLDGQSRILSVTRGAQAAGSQGRSEPSEQGTSLAASS